MVLEILVIGGSKFIGKHLVFTLAKKNDVNITVINRGKSNPNLTYPDNVTLVKADRRKPEELKKAIGDKIYDYVFDIVLIYGNDAKELLKILEGKVRNRFIYVSSASVYEVSGDPNLIESIPIFEDDPIGPTTDDQHWYLKEKRLCEQYLLDAYKNQDFPVSIVRPSFVYGPDNYIYREAYFFDRLTNDEPILLPANASHAITDFSFVEDVVDICIRCMDNEKALGQAYNAASGEMVSPDDITKIVARIMDKEPQILYYTRDDLKAVDWPENTMPPYPFNDDGKFGLSIIKAINDLGFTPKYRLKDGFKLASEWFNKNQSHLKFQKPDAESLKQLTEHLSSKNSD